MHALHRNAHADVRGQGNDALAGPGLVAIHSNTHHYQLALRSVANDPPAAVLADTKPIDIRPPPASAHARSLTAATFPYIPEKREEAMSAETAPGSPPELSSSRSSKSSSLQSSGLTNPDDINQLSNFEDINLQDSDPNLYARPPLQKRSPPRASAPAAIARPRNTEPAAGLRDLTNTSRPSHHVNSRPRRSSRDHSSPTSLRSWGFDSAKPSPSLTIPPHSGKRFAQASSLKHQAHSASPTHSDGFPRAPRHGLPPRRQSWQPSRKTARELEDEYHDSDEEIPEDAIIHNIPLSPRPSHDRAQSASPRRHAEHHSLSVTPPNPMRSRIKSWTEAMMDLSKEAKDLTAALETHSDTQQAESCAADFHPRPSFSKHRAQTVPLPLLQSRDVMIDPLPPSKEKEKVLSRTRPSWLPPKPPAEERKHLKQYQHMMLTALEAEKRKAAHAERDRKHRDSEHWSAAQHWEDHVLPNWRAAVKEPGTRELWWRGITPRSRGVVWARALGNELHLTAGSYSAALARAEVFESQSQTTSSTPPFSAIRTAASNALPELRIFQAPHGPLFEPLVRLLMAYMAYRSPNLTATTVCGIPAPVAPAALLLLTLPTPTAAFISLANLLSRPTPTAYYSHQSANPHSSAAVGTSAAKARLYAQILVALAYKLPKLHAHLTAPTLDLAAATYLDPLLVGLFADQLGVDVASRVWDVYFFEGEGALVRAVVGILYRLEGRLYGSKEEIIAIFSGEGCESNGLKGLVGNEDQVMAAMRWAGKVELDRRDEDDLEGSAMKLTEEGVRVMRVPDENGR